jgi:hypothetical protein
MHMPMAYPLEDAQIATYISRFFSLLSFWFPLANKKVTKSSHPFIALMTKPKKFQ